MSFDWLAYPLGKLLKFIYDIAFSNYGLAIIIFTFLVRMITLPLTVKQYKSTSKMQEIQPLINDIQKRYKDDKEKLNQELMKLYQEHNYNPAGGCLPMLIQMPIILTLYWVIVQPLKFMLGKDPQNQIPKLVEVAARGLGMEADKMGAMKELLTLNYFNENQAALSQVTGLLDKAELIDFRSFLGLHLGAIPTYQPQILFGPEWKIYVPLFILVIVATITTFISSKMSMPSTSNNKQQQSGPAGCSTNSMLYIGPVMTLMFGFQMPAGVILYWMVGYVFGIFQQLFINKYVIKKKDKPEAAVAAEGEKGKILDGTSSSAENNGTIDSSDESVRKQLPEGKNSRTSGKTGGSSKGGKKKGGKKK